MQFVYLLLLTLFPITTFGEAFNDATMAQNAHNQGDFDKAIKLYNKVLSNNKLPRRNIAAILANLCAARLNKNIGRQNGIIKDRTGLDHALADCNRAISLQSDHYIAYYNRAKTLTVTGKLDRAIEDFNVVIGLKPDYILAHYNRGDAFAASGHIESAIADFTHFINTNKNHELAYYKRGKLYTLAKKFDTALTDFNTAISLDPKNAIFRQHRGRIHIYQGLFDEAIKDLDAVLQLQPKNIQSRLIRGLTYFILGHYDKAKQDLTIAYELNHKDAYSLIWLFLIRERTKQASRDWLAKSASILDNNKWPMPIIDYFLGRIDSDTILEKAKAKDQVTRMIWQRETYFYVGDYLLSQGNTKQAKKWLNKLFNDEPHELVVSQLARVELERAIAAKNMIIQPGAAVNNNYNDKITHPLKKPVTEWLIVIGSYQSDTSIKRVTAQLNAGHVRFFQTPVNVGNIAFQRIRAGPFKSKDEAITVRELIGKRTALTPGKIIPYVVSERKLETK